MAKGQDQTLQIVLILFTILLIGFAGATYFMYDQFKKESAKVTQLESDLSGASTAQRSTQEQNELLRGYLGYGQFDDTEAMVDQYKKDMDRYASTFNNENDKKYTRILEVMFTENNKFTLDQANDKAKIKELEGKLLQIEQEKNKQIAAFESQLKKTEQDAAAEREKFKQDRVKLESDQQQLAKTLTEQRTKFDAERTDLNARISTLDGDKVAMQRTIDKQEELIAQQDPTFEVPDGEIKWVNQANSTVWINIGEADAVRRQVTFAVVDTDAPDVGQAEAKGSIEVTRILANHMAEARVTEDDPRNPILPGDKIFSQVWHRGQTLHFALAGKIDLNGDGRMDMDQARHLVTLNGGVVDAWVNKDGKIEGDGLSVETRYLVLGEVPEGPNDAELRKAYNDLSNEAKKLGVSTISLVDFINQMGYKGEDRMVKLGSGARAEDFRPRPNPTASEMRPRSPYITP